MPQAGSRVFRFQAFHDTTVTSWSGIVKLEICTRSRQLFTSLYASFRGKVRLTYMSTERRILLVSAISNR